MQGNKFMTGQVVQGIRSKTKYMVVGTRSLEGINLVYLKTIKPSGMLGEGFHALTEEVLELCGNMTLNAL